MNSSIEKDVQLFASVAYEKQKEIVFGMLEALKDNNVVFQHLYKTVHEIHAISTKLLLVIYQELLTLAEKKEHSIKEIEMMSFTTIHDKIATIRQQEASEKADSDQILSGI